MGNITKMQSVIALTLLCLIAMTSGVTQNNKKILNEKTKSMYIDQATKEALAVARIRERSREELEYKQTGKLLRQLRMLVPLKHFKLKKLMNVKFKKEKFVRRILKSQLNKRSTNDLKVVRTIARSNYIVEKVI